MRRTYIAVTLDGEVIQEFATRTKRSVKTVRAQLAVAQARLRKSMTVDEGAEKGE